MTKTVHMEFKCDLAIEWKYKYTQGICIKSKVSGSSHSFNSDMNAFRRQTILLVLERNLKISVAVYIFMFGACACACVRLTPFIVPLERERSQA